MDRDLHFLERTAQRLDRADMEFALSLWQQPDTLHGLLGDLKLPDGVERLALGLGVDGGGPWIVLTRQGDFVTCLGRDMAPTGLHVVPATQVAALVARGRKRQVEVAAADARAGDPARFVKKLMKTGPFLAREDFQVFAAWNEEMADVYAEVMRTQTRGMAALSHKLGKAWVRPPHAVEEGLRLYWHAYWGGPNMAPLIACDGREREIGAWAARPELLQLTPQLGTPWLLKVAWAAARIGKPLLAPLKQAHRTSAGWARLALEVALVTMALRHRSVRAEVEKLVANRAIEGKIAGPGEDIALMQGNWATRCLNEAPAMRELFLTTGRKCAFERATARGGALARQWQDQQEVPDDVAGPILVTANRGELGTAGLVATLFPAPAWLATIEAHELFLKAEDAALWHRPYRFEDGLALYHDHHRNLDRNEPLRTTRVGRNDPCPCGSGKKAKRCCGTDTPSGTHPASTPPAE